MQLVFAVRSCPLLTHTSLTLSGPAAPCPAVAAALHHFLFLQYLWTHRAKSWGLALLLCSPVCLVPALLCDVPALRYFGAVGAVAAVLQYFSMKHVRHVGMRVI